MFAFLPPDDLSLSLFSGFELTANIQYYNERTPLVSHTHFTHSPFSRCLRSCFSEEVLAFSHAPIGRPQAGRDPVTSDPRLRSDPFRVTAGFFYLFTTAHWH